MGSREDACSRVSSDRATGRRPVRWRVIRQRRSTRRCLRRLGKRNLVVPVAPLEVELDATGATIGGTRVKARAPRAARCARASSRQLAHRLVYVCVPISADLRSLACFQAAAGTELTSVPSTTASEVLEVGVGHHLRANRPAPSRAPRLTLRPSERFPFRAPAIVCRAHSGDAGSERRFRDLLKSACGDDACVVRVALSVDSEHSDIIHVLEAYQRATAELPRLRALLPCGCCPHPGDGLWPPPARVIQRVVRQLLLRFASATRSGLARKSQPAGAG